MIISRFIPKGRLLIVPARNPRLVRYVSEPTYDAKGFAPRPFMSNLSEYWFYPAAAALASFMYFVMSSPLSEITPAVQQKYPNQYSDKWYFLYPELENYVKNNYETLKKEKTDAKIVIREVIDATMAKKDN